MLEVLAKDTKVYNWNLLDWKKGHKEEIHSGKYFKKKSLSIDGYTNWNVTTNL